MNKNVTCNSNDWKLDLGRTRFEFLTGQSPFWLRSADFLSPFNLILDSVWTAFSQLQKLIILLLVSILSETTLRCKPEGHGFDNRWGELPNPSSHIMPWGLLSLRQIWEQGKVMFLEVERQLCVRLTTLLSSEPTVEIIWNPQHLTTLWPSRSVEGTGLFCICR
jgi:hypothetical protein